MAGISRNRCRSLHQNPEALRHSMMTWEQAVDWYRSSAENTQGVVFNYFDLPVVDAANRFWHSEEFAACLSMVRAAGGHGKILDLGAGNGIASYAWAMEGFEVTALEPDRSDTVGCGAIQNLAEECGLNISVVAETSHPLPFPDAAFDVVYARQVLHHLPNLKMGIAELHRLLKPRGLLLSTRDHVVRNREELDIFLSAHALHRHYGGENAFSLEEYRDAFRQAGFRDLTELGHFESVINFYPGSEADRKAWIAERSREKWGVAGALIANSDFGRKLLVRRLQEIHFSAGSLVTYLAKKS
jgi:SAM-dependent methyltransferase